MNWGEKYGGYRHAEWDDLISWITVALCVFNAVIIAIWSFS
jgi:hypothetical protein